MKPYFRVQDPRGSGPLLADSRNCLCVTRTLAAALLCAVITTSIGQTITERSAKGELTFMNDDEPAMQEAFRKARVTLPAFLEKLRSRPPGNAFYSVKIGIPAGEDVEYIWLGDLDFIGADFVGTVNNKPRLSKAVQHQQRYRFSRGDIVDWSYIDVQERRRVGNFTLCALLSKETPQGAESAKEGFAVTCE